MATVDTLVTDILECSHGMEKALDAIKSLNRLFTSTDAKQHISRAIEKQVCLSLIEVLRYNPESPQAFCLVVDCFHSLSAKGKLSILSFVCIVYLLYVCINLYIIVEALEALTQHGGLATILASYRFHPSSPVTKKNELDMMTTSCKLFYNIYYITWSFA